MSNQSQTIQDSAVVSGLLQRIENLKLELRNEKRDHLKTRQRLAEREKRIGELERLNANTSESADAIIRELEAKRNDVLKSLDKAKIIAYSKKYGVPLPENDLVMWAGVHKARLLILNFSDAEKEVSRQWLKDHGFREESF